MGKIPALSRLKQGFDSPRERQIATIQNKTTNPSARHKRMHAAAAGQRLPVNRREVLGVSSRVARTASIRSTSSETGPVLSHA
jgi:hypothetical protein